MYHLTNQSKLIWYIFVSIYISYAFNVVIVLLLLTIYTLDKEKRSFKLSILHTLLAIKLQLFV